MIRVLPTLSAVAVALAALAVGGCAHDAADRHASEMRDGIARLQGETDRLGLGAEDEAAVAPTRVARAGDGGVKLPVPRTIQLGGPESDGEDDDPNAPSARPRIELSGPPGAASRPAPRGRDRERERGPSTGRARDTRIEMLGPTPEGEDPAAPGAAPAPPAPPAAEPSKGDGADGPKAAPKPDAPRRRGDKGRRSDDKATTKETR